MSLSEILLAIIAAGLWLPWLVAVPFIPAARRAFREYQQQEDDTEIEEIRDLFPYLGRVIGKPLQMSRMVLLYGDDSECAVIFPPHHVQGEAQVETVELASTPARYEGSQWLMALEAEITSPADPDVITCVIADFVGVRGNPHNYLYGTAQLLPGGVPLREGPTVGAGEILHARLQVRCELPHDEPVTVKIRATLVGREAISRIAAY